MSHLNFLYLIIIIEPIALNFINHLQIQNPFFLSFQRNLNYFQLILNFDLDFFAQTNFTIMLNRLFFRMIYPLLLNIMGYFLFFSLYLFTTFEKYSCHQYSISFGFDYLIAVVEFIKYLYTNYYFTIKSQQSLKQLFSIDRIQHMNSIFLC